MKRKEWIISMLVMASCIGCADENDCACDEDTACGAGDTAKSTDSETGEASLPFVPTNLVDLSLAGITGDLVFDRDSRGMLNFNPGEASASPDSAYTYQEVVQSDGSRLAVFAARNVRIEAGVWVRVHGTMPVALVALETMVIAGTLDAGADGGRSYAGGFEGPAITDTSSDGNGPGGGFAGAGEHSGGGGSHCGTGGTDGNGEGVGGRTYGNDILSPLIGGSSGGGVFAGAGGGAVELVAGESVHIVALGAVTTGGGGGDWGGAGSGGAVLIEAPEVIVDGVVAANGGGGGSIGQVGENAKESDSPAAGASNDSYPGDEGGNGSAGAAIDGGDGRCSAIPCHIPGTGGGGAGWIRVNTASGDAVVSGVLSPSADTECATFGQI